MNNDEKNMVIIPLDEYRELVRATERINTLERMFAKSNYVGTGDIKIVLGIEEQEKENEHEAV